MHFTLDPDKRLVTPLNNRRYINYFIYLSIYLQGAAAATRWMVATSKETIRLRRQKSILFQSLKSLH